MTEKLSQAARDAVMEPLLQSGWSYCEDRDAIRKSFVFANFVDAFGLLSKSAIWA